MTDETAKFCSECGIALTARAVPLRKKRAETSPNSVPAAKNTATVEADREETIALTAKLTHLQYWGFHNVATEIGSILFPGAGILTGLAMFCFNPVWWIVGPVFATIGLHRLEKGDFTGARTALWWGRGVNGAIVFAVVFWGFLALRFKAGESPGHSTPGRRAARMLRAPTGLASPLSLGGSHGVLAPPVPPGSARPRRLGGDASPHPGRFPHHGRRVRFHGRSNAISPCVIFTTLASSEAGIRVKTSRAERGRIFISDDGLT